MSDLDEIWYVDNYLAKKMYNEFEKATAFFWLTTTAQTTAQATGGAGVRGSSGRGREGPHHHQQDIMIFSLRREPPLLVANIEMNGKITNGTCNYFPFRWISLPAGSLGAKFNCIYLRFIWKMVTNSTFWSPLRNEVFYFFGEGKRLQKLSHFRSRKGPRTTLVPIVFIVPDPMRRSRIYDLTMAYFLNLFYVLWFSKIWTWVFHPIWVIFGQRRT